MSRAEESRVRSLALIVALDRRVYGALEIVVITLATFFVLWRIGPELEVNGLAPLVMALLVMAAIYVAYVSPAIIHGDSLGRRGLGRWNTGFVRTDNLLPAARAYLPALIAGSLLFILAALIRDPGIFSRLNWYAFFLKFGFYLTSALGQDLLFMSFFLLRLNSLVAVCDGPAQSPQELRRAEFRKKILASSLLGALFCIYHFPNPALMAISLIAGFSAAWIYDAYPNLLLVVCCHALLGTLLHRVLEMHMRVGPFYWNSKAYIFRNLVPITKEWIGDLF